MTIIIPTLTPAAVLQCQGASSAAVMQSVQPIITLIQTPVEQTSQLCQTSNSSSSHPPLTQLTHDSLILLDILLLLLLEPGNPDPVSGLPLTVTGLLCVTCKLSLPVMHRAPAPRSSPRPPPPPSPAHRRHPGHILRVLLLQQNVAGILIFNRQTGNQSHLHNLSVVPMSHSALAPTSI